MEIGHRHFRSRRQKKFAVFQAVHVFFKFRQLCRADHAIAPDQKRGTDFGVAMLPRMQIEHEINQRPLQFRTRTGETDESASAQLRCAIEIE